MDKPYTGEKWRPAHQALQMLGEKFKLLEIAQEIDKLLEWANENYLY